MGQARIYATPGFRIRSRLQARLFICPIRVHCNPAAFPNAGLREEEAGGRGRGRRRERGARFASFANNAAVEHCFCDGMIRRGCIMHDMMMLVSTWSYYPASGEVPLRNTG
jgi:hypothetical protein